MVRPDLFGLLRLANGSFTGDTPPNIKLCVLKAYANNFRGDLPDWVDIVPVEDQFESKNFHSISLSKPNFEDLGLTVDFILRETLAFRGNRGLPFKLLAFCKDLWSLYCMWRFGGYHLDCGCLPADVGATTFPEPTTYGVVANDAESGSFPHGKTRFASGVVCSTLVTGNRVFSDLVLGSSFAETSKSNLKRLLDVWLLRSPAGHVGAQKALEFYLHGWFEIRSKNLNENLHAQALRELVVSAVCTGVTHSGHGIGCSGMNLYKTHLIDATFNPARVPSMNLRKVGFQSHQG
jgi:hypothetical protein